MVSFFIYGHLTYILTFLGGGLLIDEMTHDSEGKSCPPRTAGCCQGDVIRNPTTTTQMSSLLDDDDIDEQSPDDDITLLFDETTDDSSLLLGYLDPEQDNSPPNLSTSSDLLASSSLAGGAEILLADTDTNNDDLTAPSSFSFSQDFFDQQQVAVAGVSCSSPALFFVFCFFLVPLSFFITQFHTGRTRLLYFNRPLY